MYKISLADIDKLFEKLSCISSLYMPVDSVFTKYHSGVKYDFNALNTVKSPKDFFFPQVENIAKFKMQGKTIEITENLNVNEPFILFGVRACDAKSLVLLDRVFLSEPCDPYYKSRRESGMIITAACNRPEESCFCTSFGVDPTEPQGDVSVWFDSDCIYWQSNTQKGNALTQKLSDILVECDAVSADECKKKIKNIISNLPFGKLDLSYWQKTSEKELFSLSAWDEIYHGCLGCGACTFVCPTCQCYDVKDFVCGETVQKFRCWDSCMYSDFTKMAHGNPRKTQKERFRQRFMHKLKYFPVNNDGEFACVGCGRCVKSCPQSINIIKVARSVAND